LAGSVVFYLLFGVATVMRSLSLLLVARIGAGIAGATISTAQAYIADTTSLEKRSKGMALIGMAFGLGFTFGPLLGFLAVPGGQGEPGPWPGYAAAILSAVALVLAIWKLPESLRPDSRAATARIAHLYEFRLAMSVPSIGLLLAAIFVCIFSFANFETTLSMLIKGSTEAENSPFRFTWGQVCLTYAYIGLTMTVVQGVLVRRLAGRVPEGRLAGVGALLQVVGFAVVIVATGRASAPLLMAALGIVTAGAGLMQPNLNSLLSRRSDPEKQGAIMGVGQSVNSLARILGAGLGIPMLKIAMTLPYYVCMGIRLQQVAGFDFQVAVHQGGGHVFRETRPATARLGAAGRSAPAAASSGCGRRRRRGTGPIRAAAAGRGVEQLVIAHQDAQRQMAADQRAEIALDLVRVHFVDQIGHQDDQRPLLAVRRKIEERLVVPRFDQLGKAVERSVQQRFIWLMPPRGGT
jgi:MFS transporter, DHA1 family, tetracycline resistance protein